jgi:hypothetical protein
MLVKWTVAFLAVVGAFVLAGVAGGLAADSLGYWSTPAAGFSAALAVVLVAYFSAPARKLLAAASAFVVGAAAAWSLLEPSFFPESYGERGGYEPTHLPIVATYIGGLLGLLASVCLRRWAGPNNSSKPTPLRGAA